MISENSGLPKCPQRQTNLNHDPTMSKINKDAWTPTARENRSGETSLKKHNL